MVKIEDKEFLFNNHVDSCIGTGRMGLALQKEYLDQLEFVQKYIGFKHIRGHGLFSDDMAIYQERDMSRFGEGITIDYNFTYLDLVMDSYRRLGLKPYLELGFMPNKMASGEQTIFYWKGNVTPPKDYDAWAKLLKVTLEHLISRYGLEEVLTWPVEVWNEPNLKGFWKDASKEEYFKLFKVSFNAVKSVNKDFKVGGPAVCGGSDKEWIQAFLEFCDKEDIRPDYISRHHYCTDQPLVKGHYGYQKLLDPENEEDGFPNLHSTREIIDSFPKFKGLPIHITEFNTSYIPNCPLHDTNLNAAYIAHQLSRLGDDNVAYSYWTFGDIFEEFGVPFTPFHGGFGLVANGIIPKPTFWTFVFFKNLKEKEYKCVYKDEYSVIVKFPDGEYRGVLWNRFTEDKEMSFEFANDEYSFITETVDKDTCNPLKIWHDMGEPSSLSESQKDILRRAANPLVSSSRSDGKLSFNIKADGVIYFTLKPNKITPDRGYDFDLVTGG
ncbi:MAG: xylan 1,4-beta-xylosidase [Clostridiales bacterium]|nr:xylan 1,4-beta-xylosidase [Clostridiales bacterium]